MYRIKIIKFIFRPLFTNLLIYSLTDWLLLEKLAVDELNTAAYSANHANTHEDLNQATKPDNQP